jgi:hypothetical protein
LSAVHVKYVISATSFGSTQCTREGTSGDPKRVLRDGGALNGDVLRASGSSLRRKSARTLTGMHLGACPSKCSRAKATTNCAMDLSEIVASYKSGLGQSRLPTATLIGSFSSIRRTCSNDTVRSSRSSTHVKELPGDPPNSSKVI